MEPFNNKVFKQLLFRRTVPFWCSWLLATDFPSRSGPIRLDPRIRCLLAVPHVRAEMN